MAENKKDSLEHGLKAAKANAKDSQEEQQVQELSSKLQSKSADAEYDQQ